MKKRIFFFRDFPKNFQNPDFRASVAKPKLRSAIARSAKSAYASDLLRITHGKRHARIGIEATASRSVPAHARPDFIILYACDAIIAALSVHSDNGG